MCQELTNELATGKQLATDLVEHLIRMGASKASIPVQVDVSAFLVTIERCYEANGDHTCRCGRLVRDASGYCGECFDEME